MKELERISDYITELETECAKLYKQVDKLKEQLNKASTTAANSAELQSVDKELTTPNDEVTLLRNYIKRLGTAVEWKYTDQEELWTDSQINELAGIVEGNHLSRKNLDAMVDEIYAITRELQNDNFGLYHTLTGTHISLNTYNFESTHALAETIQKLADSFIRSCEHLEVAIGNLEVAQLCNLNKEIAECVDSAHKWRVKSGALRWLDHRH